MSDCTQALKERIAQLEAKVQALEQKAQAQHQEIAQKYGKEFLCRKWNGLGSRAISNCISTIELAKLSYNKAFRRLETYHLQ